MEIYPKELSTLDHLTGIVEKISFWENKKKWARFIK